MGKFSSESRITRSHCIKIEFEHIRVKIKVKSGDDPEYKNFEINDVTL